MNAKKAIALGSAIVIPGGVAIIAYYAYKHWRQPETDEDPDATGESFFSTLIDRVRNLVNGKGSVLKSQVRTGDTSLDQWLDDLVDELLARKPDAGAMHARALVAILHNESGGKFPIIGDKGDQARGPSIGPMQVFRKTAEDLGLWSADDESQAYLEYYQKGQDATDENQSELAVWGVSVFLDKLRIARAAAEKLGHRDDEQAIVNDAIRRYNGSGSLALSYQSRALAFIDKTYS